MAHNSFACRRAIVACVATALLSAGVIAFTALDAFGSTSTHISLTSGWELNFTYPGDYESTGCYLQPYSWGSTLAVDTYTDTSAHTILVDNVDWYSGWTSPNPVAGLPNWVYGPDSWLVRGSSGSSYQLSGSSSINQVSFYSATGTKYPTWTSGYSAGQVPYIYTEFGAADGTGGVDSRCEKHSYVVLQP